MSRVPGPGCSRPPRSPATSKAWASDPRFEQIFLRHYQGLVQVLWRMVGERAQAEELADDVFWKLHQQPALWTQEEIGGWLYRTATHAGIDAIRARSRRGKHEQAAARAALQTGTPRTRHYVRSARTTFGWPWPI